MMGKHDAGYYFTAMKTECAYRSNQVFDMFLGYVAHIGYVK